MVKKVLDLGFHPNDAKKYKMEAIRNRFVHVNKAKDYLPSLYYLIAWKMYFKKYIRTFFSCRVVKKTDPFHLSRANVEINKNFLAHCFCLNNGQARN